MVKLVMGDQIPHQNLIASINQFISKNKHCIKPTIFKFKFKLPNKPQSFNQSDLLINTNAFQSTLNSNVSSSQYHMDEQITHFIATCIEYCVLKQVKDVCVANHQRVEVLIGMMREFYLNMTREGEWKKQFIFEQNVIFVTKIVAEFYNTMFLNLSANGKLESQIYIILMHTLLGVKINTACFQVLEKKHIRKTQSKRDNKENKELINKKESKDKNGQKRSTVMKKPMRNDRESMLMYYSSKRSSFNKMNKTLMENDRETDISPAQQFKNSLKESLYINPLPKLKKPKASIESFTTQNYHQLNSFELQDNKSKQYQRQARNSSFLSTEISSSLKSEIERRNVSISIQNHPFNIKHRFPYSSTHSFSIKHPSTLENNRKTENQSFLLKQQTDSSKFNSQQWNTTFKGLRSAYRQQEANYIQGKKGYKQDKQFYNRLQSNDSKSEIGSKSLMNSTISFDLSIKEKGEIRKIKQRQTCGFQSFKPEKFAKRQPSFIEEKQPFQFRLDCGTKDYKKIELADFCIERPKKNNISSKFLKSQQLVFDLLAKQRKQKIKYSMFMLPSMRDKLGI